jgi:hypothetical protein
MVPPFRNETYGNVKTLGYNVKGRIIQGQGHIILVPPMDVMLIIFLVSVYPNQLNSWKRPKEFQYVDF